MASSRKAGTNESRWTNPGDAGSFEAGVNTIGTSGYDYTSFSTWEADTDLDLVTNTASPVLELMESMTLTNLSCAGSTTSTAYFRCVRNNSAVRHGGVAGAGAQLTGATAGNTLNVGENNVHLWDLDVITSFSSASSYKNFSVGAYTGVQWVGCLSKMNNSGAGVGSGFQYDNSGHTALRIVNCCAYECDGDGFHTRLNDTCIYNCTSVDNAGWGFQYTTQSPIMKNCIGHGNAGGDFEGAQNTSTHNLSSDTSAPPYNTYYTSKTVTFVDAANDDYRITNDADVVGTGTDLSADGGFAFDDDVAYTTRS